MSETRKAFIESIETLEEGKLKDLLTAGLVGGSLLMANPSDTNAKTDFNKLHANHEIAASYEHGGKGNASINPDNYGGYSYGKNQISTERRKGKPSTFDFFLKFMKDHDPTLALLFDLAGGWEAAYKGDKEFQDFWKTQCNKPEFNQLYDSFILSTQIVPTYKTMDASKDKNLDKVTTWASENDAVQAAIHSTIIQHGPAGARKMIKHVMEYYKPKTPLGFVHELYKYRGKKFPGLKSRYTNEVKDIKSYFKNLTNTTQKKQNKTEPQLVYPEDIRTLFNKMKNKSTASDKQKIK